MLSHDHFTVLIPHCLIKLTTAVLALLQSQNRCFLHENNTFLDCYNLVLDSTVENLYNEHTGTDTLTAPTNNAH